METNNSSTDLDPLGEFDTGDNAPVVPAAPESTSTNRDAGLLGDDIVDGGNFETSAEFDAQIESELMDEFSTSDLDENFADADVLEVPTSQLDIESLDDPVTRATLRSPEMDAPDTPGQIDIEALGDFDLDDTDLPADARLDPIEE